MARKPFFSGNYGSALARVDTRPIVEAGRAQGQMFANMGSQIGGMIKEYGLNKEKRAELTDQIESAIKFNPEYLTRMTSTGDEAADKEAQNKLDKLAKGDLNMTQLKGLAGDLAMMEKVDLKAEKEEDRKIANLYKTTLTKQAEQSTASKKLIDDLSKSKLKREDQLRKSYGAQGRTIIEQLKGTSNITEAFNKLTPGQQKLVRNLDAIESGVYDLEKLDFDPFDNQKFTTGNINIKKLLGEVDEQKTKSAKEQKGEKYYQGLQEELETDLTYQMGDFSKMTPRELWLASNESNIAQRQPLEKFDPNKVEEYKQAVLQTQQDTIEGRGQQQIVDAGGIVAPQGALQMVDGQLSRIGTPAEQMTTQNFEQATQGIPGTPTIKPVDVDTAFRGQATEMVEDFGNSVSMFFTGEPMDTFADGKNAVQQVQNLSTIKNTVQPVLLNEFGGKITNFQMTQVQENIPLKTDSRAVGREKLENLTGLMEAQLSKANLYLQTTKPGTENYADAAYVKRQIEANLPMLKQAFQSKQSYTTPANIRKILDSNKTKPSAQVDTNASNVDLSGLTIDQLLQMQNR